MRRKSTTLTPGNSYFPPITFSIHGEKFMIGVWTFVLDQLPYLMLLVDDDGWKTSGYFMQRPMSPAGFLRYGGVVQCLTTVFSSWTEVLVDKFGLGGTGEADDVEKWFLALGAALSAVIDTDPIAFRPEDISPGVIEVLSTPWEGSLN